MKTLSLCMITKNEEKNLSTDRRLQKGDRDCEKICGSGIRRRY